MEKYLILNRVCQINDYRTEMKIIDGKTSLLAQANMHTMFQFGKKETQDYARRYKSYKIAGKDKPILTRPYAMTESEYKQPASFGKLTLISKKSLLRTNTAKLIVHMVA